MFYKIRKNYVKLIVLKNVFIAVSLTAKIEKQQEKNVSLKKYAQRFQNIGRTNNEKNFKTSTPNKTTLFSREAKMI
jgi:hypothetical protein